MTVFPSPGAGLVGRDRERAAVVAALDRLGGTTVWLSVAGEPGIGKTRLLAELASEAGRRGYPVLAGRGAEFEQDLPFGAWIDAMDAYLGAQGAAALDLEDGPAGELAAVFPALAELGATPRPPPPAERYRLHRATRGLVESLARSSPVVVIIDDLQWADAASWELLVYLMRRAPVAPVLIAVAFRAGGLPGQVAAAMEAATRDGDATALWLAPLSRGEAAQLVGHGPELDRCYRQSGGNPFYLQQLAKAAPAAADDADPLDDDVPAAVRAALAAEVEALSEPARRLAEGAAVAGEPFTPELAARAAGLVESTALDELLLADLVRRTDVPRRYRFRHPIVRRAVYHHPSESWRADAHARIAAELADAGAALPVRAHHLERSARPGDTDAVSQLAQAGRHVAHQSPSASARWLSAALGLLPADRPDHRLGLVLELVGALMNCGRVREGRDRLAEAVELSPTGPPRAQLVAACAAAERLLGLHDIAERRLHDALAQLPSAPTVESVALHVGMATNAANDGRFERSQALARRARRDAERCDAPALAAQAAAVEAFGQSYLPAGEDDPVGVAGALVEALPDAVLAQHVNTLLLVGQAAHWAERYELAEAHFRRGLTLSRAGGQGQLLMPLQAGLGHILVGRGRLAEAAQHTDAALDAARLGGVPQLLAWAVANHGWTLATAGDLPGALVLADEAVGLLDQVDPGVIASSVHGHAGAIYRRAGDAARGSAQLRSAGAPEFRLCPLERRCVWYAELAAAELDLGRREVAEEWVRRGEQVAVGELPVSAATVARARAGLLLHDGDPAGAADLALGAAAGAHSRGAPIEAARSRLLAARALAGAGERERSRAEYARAQAALAACGAAVADADPLEGPDGAVDGLAALSGREREVARLVAAGHTNRQIARDMYLSEKTVEGYLTQAYAKLGVRSRAGLAELVGRQQGGGPADRRPGVFKGYARVFPGAC